jgi:hypothetical protein
MSNKLHTNYVKLTGRELTILGEMTNFMGQHILLVEHPIHGEDAPVIAICHEHMSKGDDGYVYGAAANTTFFDTDDMYEGSDYEPLFFGDKLTYRYVIQNYDQSTEF